MHDDDEEEDDDDDDEEEDDETHADCNLLSVHVMPPDELSLVAASCYDLCSKKVGFYQDVFNLSFCNMEIIVKY